MSRYGGFGFLILSVVGIMVNHFVVDWEKITVRRVDAYLDELITSQKEDLVSWDRGITASDRFEKRTYCNGNAILWNSNGAWPEITEQMEELAVIDGEDGIYLVQSHKSDSCVNYSVFPLSKEYAITNQYLKSRKNILLPKPINHVSTNEGSFQFNGLIYYDLEIQSSKSLDAIFCVILIVAVLSIFWKEAKKRFLLSLAVLLGLRLLSLYLGVLEGLISYPLFDPIYYRSSWVNPTLGDLFVNCLIILIGTIVWSRSRRGLPELRRFAEVLQLIVGLLLSVSLYSVIWSVLDNSQVSLDMGKSIQFNLLRTISYLCLLLIVGSVFLIGFRIVGYLRRAPSNRQSFIILIGSSVLISVFTFPGGLAALMFSVLVIAVSKLNWGDVLVEFRYENLQFALMISVISAVVFAFSVYKFHEKSELDSKKKFANQLLIKRDILGEFYLSQVLEELNQTQEEKSEGDLKTEVEYKFSNPYFDKYVIEVVDSASAPCRYLELRSSIAKASSSDYSSIYLIDQENEYSYICEVDFLLINLSLKRRVPNSVFPALLTDSKYYSTSYDFDYAVFTDGEILFQRSKFGQGEWPDANDFIEASLYEEGLEKNGRHYFGVQTSDGRVILIISRKYGRSIQMTNFSFFFLTNFFFLGAIVILSSLSREQIRLNFTGKIQLYLGLAFIIPLFSVGFALLNSLNNSYKEEINRSYLKQALYISELLGSELNSSGKVEPSHLLDVRDHTQTDISLYSAAGDLLLTSQPEIFELHLQSKKINPQVFTELVAKENQSMIADESIGSLDYKVSYATLNNREDEVVGFIAMPFFDSKNHLRRQLLEVFGSLVTIFGFIFMLAVFFGRNVLDNLMQPLRLVAAEMRKITLQEQNKPILYEAGDEIGSLVSDYNSMLIKLEENKAALARSQKETAWKEIARQVAHEIKNPLTPMQLKVQQLLRKHSKSSREHEILSGLLTQVETLSLIANSFSAFAEMPVPDNVDFDVSSLLEQVVELYQSDEIRIIANISKGVTIHADKDIFQRILNNIFLNAIQSVENRKALIAVDLYANGNKCHMSIKDNGIGIPEEIREKIFLKYYSTKNSGSGIGLALSKKGIESAGGNIWFETEIGKGTTFFITMPLVAS